MAYLSAGSMSASSAFTMVTDTPTLEPWTDKENSDIAVTLYHTEGGGEGGGGEGGGRAGLTSATLAVYSAGMNMGVLSLMSSKLTTIVNVCALALSPPSVAVRIRVTVGLTSRSRTVGSCTEMTPGWTEEQ